MAGRAVHSGGSRGLAAPISVLGAAATRGSTTHSAWHLTVPGPSGPSLPNSSLLRRTQAGACSPLGRLAEWETADAELVTLGAGTPLPPPSSPPSFLLPPLPTFSHLPPFFLPLHRSLSAWRPRAGLAGQTLTHPVGTCRRPRKLARGRSQGCEGRRAGSRLPGVSPSVGAALHPPGLQSSSPCLSLLPAHAWEWLASQIRGFVPRVLIFGRSPGPRSQVGEHSGPAGQNVADATVIVCAWRSRAGAGSRICIKHCGFWV